MARTYKGCEELIADRVARYIESGSERSGVFSVEAPAGGGSTIYADVAYVLEGRREWRAEDLGDVWVCTEAYVSVRLMALDGEGNGVEPGASSRSVEKIVEDMLTGE